MSGHRYWRLRVLASNGDAGMELPQIDWRNLGSVINNQSNATYTASFTFAGYGAIKAASPYTAPGWASNFDGNFSNMWWQADFGVDVDVDSIAIAAATVGRSPHVFQILSSDDGSSFTLEWSVTSAGFTAKTTFDRPPAVPVPARARVSVESALVVYAANVQNNIRLSQEAMLVPWAFSSRRTRVSDEAALVVYASSPDNPPRVSQEAAVVVWGITPPGSENRTRAWAFTLDGHLFYVLDLGLEGTWLYDHDTAQWSQWETSGYTGWNMHVGTTWQTAQRIVAGDLLNGYVWEMSPTDLVDEEFRSIEHIATGGVMTRSRIYLGVESIRLSGSIGQIQDPELGVTTYMSFSDDAGETWSEEYAIVIQPGEQADGFELNYRSLGSFMAPGRVVKFRDQGGMLRIDGADIFLDNFDNEQELGSG